MSETEFEDMDANEIVKYIIENVDSMTDKKIEALEKKVNEILEEKKKEVNENETEKKVFSGYCTNCGEDLTKEDTSEKCCPKCGGKDYIERE